MRKNECTFLKIYKYQSLYFYEKRKKITIPNNAVSFEQHLNIIFILLFSMMRIFRHAKNVANFGFQMNFASSRSDRGLGIRKKNGKIIYDETTFSSLYTVYRCVNKDFNSVPLLFFVPRGLCHTTPSKPPGIVGSFEPRSALSRFVSKILGTPSLPRKRCAVALRRVASPTVHPTRERTRKRDGCREIQQPVRSGQFSITVRFFNPEKTLHRKRERQREKENVCALLHKKLQ